jgi:hypothetical protein
MQDFIKPEVGQGVTLHYPQDSYPFVITEVSASGKTIKIQPVEPVSRDTGHEPARFDGPWPVWSHTYTAEELQTLKRETPTPDTLRYNSRSRRWAGRNGDWSVGVARYHRNYSY